MTPAISIGGGQGMHRAVIALVCAAVMCAAMALPGAAAADDERAAERAVFTDIAKELTAQIRADPAARATDGSTGPPKLAIAPFKDDALPLAPALGREFNDLLTAELLAVPEKSFRVMSRDSLKALIEDIFETDGTGTADGNVIAALLESTQVERIGAEILTVSYEATNRDGGTLAQAAPRRLPWRREYGQDLSAHTFDVAVEQAVRVLSSSAPDLALLRLGGIRFQASGQLTGFSHYLEDSLSVAFKAEYANAVSGRSLRVEGVELSAEELNAMRGVEAPESNLRNENLGAGAGAYTLTGSYWPQGEIIEIRLSLTAAGGGSTGWKGAVFESDIGQVALRPSGDFGTWRRKDGIGPIAFTLTTDNGQDPVYRVGEKMNLIVQADRDIWLRCYYLQQDGMVFQIFPNPYQSESAIAGGRPHTIPGQNFPFDFDILPPAGKELVKCFALGADIAGHLPPEFTQDEFAPLPPAMKHNLPRLFRALKGVAMTEQSMVINVVE